MNAFYESDLKKKKKQLASVPIHIDSSEGATTATDMLAENYTF